jgi:hypothetical protein
MADSKPMIDRLALEQEFGGFQQPSLGPGLPNIPFVGVPDPAFPEGGYNRGDSLEDWQARMKQASPLPIDRGAKRYSIAEGTSPRFDFYDPLYDNEDAAARGQSYGSTVVNALGKGLALTGTTFLQSTVGMVNGLAEWQKTGKFSSFYNNDLNAFLDDINKTLEDKLPNYYTNAERNANWYEPSKLFSKNFFWDGIIKNMGFAAGAALAGGVYTAGIRALSALPGVSRLVSIGKQAEVLAATEEGLLAADKAASTYGKIKSLSDKFLRDYNLLNPGGRAVVAGLSTVGEAGFEAYHNLNDFRNRLIEDYEFENGRPPQGVDLENINKRAEEAGNTAFALNTVLLTATNYIQFPKIIGSTYKGEKGIISSLARQTDEIIDDAGTLVAASSKRSGVLNTINKIRPYTFSISEGFEEGSQFAISKATEDYFNKKYENEETDFFDSILTGVRETLTTNEGMENILIGGFSGAIMQAKGTYLEQREKGKNTIQAVEAMNKFKLSDFTKATYDAVNRGVAIQQDREQFIAEGRVLDAKDKEADYIINYLTPRIRYGRFDLVADDIDQHRRLASTEEGLNQLKAEGKILESDTKEAVLNRLNVLESVAENVKSLYQSLNLRYGDVKNEEGELLYSDTVMEKMVYAASKVADYDRRLMQLQLSVPATTIDLNSAIKDAVKGDSSKFDVMIDEIIDMDILEEKKVEYIEAVEDVAKMSYRRDKFLKEYSEIKLNPKAFDSLPPLSTDGGDEEKVDKDLIKITTSVGEKEIRIGESYMLGKTVKYDEKGREVVELPIFKVLGVNEDGTIRVKTAKGERNIDPEYFEEFKVSSLKSVNKRPIAKFYARHVNTIVYKNLGGKKGGKRPGRLLYFAEEKNEAGEVTSPEKLFLIYKNPKGKVVEEEITLSMFQPKPGTKYKQGILTLGKKLTAVDEADIAERAKADEERNRAIRADRVSILSQMFDDISNQQDDIAKLIEEKKSKIENIDSQLNSLRQTVETAEGDKRKKTFKFKKAASIALESSIELMRMRQQLADEIEMLESQRADLEYELAMISDAEQNIDELPFDTEELIDELSDQVDMLESTILDLGGQINSLSDLYDATEKTLKSAISFLKDLVSDFSNKFKGVPLMDIRSQEFLDYVKSLKTTLDPFNYALALEKMEVYKKDIDQLDRVVAEIEDAEITPNEKFIEDLRKEIDEIQSKLSDLAKEKEIKTKIRDRFQKLFLEAEQKKLEEQRIMRDKLLIEEAIGTRDKGQRAGVFDPKEKFEQDAKKDPYTLVRSTSPITKDMKASHIRANNFGVRLNSFANRDAIRGVYVTLQTEEQLGLGGLMERLRTDDQGNVDQNVEIKTTIAMVMVEEAPDGSFVLLDEFGNPIPKGADAVNLAVYQTFPLENLQWLNGTTMFRRVNGEPIVDEEDLKKQYAKWRESVLAKTTPEAHQIDSSFGFLQYTRNAEGEVDYDTRTSVVDAGLITQEDLEVAPTVFVSTTTDEISKGTTAFTNTLGRVFLELKNAYVKLNNRRLSKDEGETIFKVILQLSKNMVDPKIGIKNPKSNALLKYLKSMVYWGIPQTIEKERKPDGYNSIYFDKAKDGSLQLHISGLGKTFLFTPTELIKNKSEILTYLSVLHNDVKSHMIKNINEKYEQIIDITDDGEVVSITWPNYQTFLLSPTAPDGTKRKDPLPLSTIGVPLTEPGQVNRYGVYFYTTDTADDFTIIQKKKPVKAAAVPVIPTAKQPVKPVPYTGDTAQPGNVFTLPSGNKILYHFNSTVITSGDLKEITILPASVPMVEQRAKETNIELADAVQRIKTAILNEIKKANQPTTAAVDASGISIEGFPGVSTIATEDLPSIEEEYPAYDIEGYSPLAAAPSAPVTPAAPASTEVPTIDPSVEELLRQSRLTEDDSDEVYRQLSNEYQDEEVETEDWNQVESWFKKNLPNVPVYRVMNILKGKGGLRAWGMFKKASVYIYKNAEIGTGYHEAFEAVWGMFTTPEERASIVSEFKKRKGSFKDRVSGKTIKYSDATDFEAKEQMAEEFRDYILYGKSPITPELKVSAVKKFFIQLWRTIKELFGGKKQISELEKLFEKINTGGFRDVVPTKAEEILQNAGIIDIDNERITDDAELRPIPGISDKKRAEIIQHMTFLMLRDIVKSDKSLFTIPDDISKSEVYDKLKSDVITTINRKIAGIEKLRDDKIITADRASKEIAPLINLMNNVFNQWESIVEDHQNYIRSYDIEFDDFDETLRRSDERTKETDDYVNSNKIDHFKKANGAIKLLLSTIPLVEPENPQQYKRSSMNGAILIPMSNAYMTIMNNVHDATNLEDMMGKLKRLAIRDPNYRALYKRLTRDSNFGSPTPNIGEVRSVHHLQLLSSFYSVFKKARPDVTIVTAMRNGDVYVGEAYLSSVANQLRNDFITEIVNRAQEGKGYLVPDKNNKKFIGSAAKAEDVNAQSKEEVLKFLNTLGINFSTKEYNLLSSTDKEKLAEEARGILKFIRDGKEIVSVNKRSLDISGRLMEIARLKAKISTQDFASTFFGVDRERKQSYIGTNPITDLQDFIYSVFRFDFETVGNTVYRYLFTDPFSKNSVVLSRMFTSSGIRKRGNDVDDLLRVGYVDGLIDELKSKAKSSDRLNYPERLIQELNLNLAGKYLNLVPGDASIEWFVKMGNHVSLQEIGKGVDSYLGIFLNYLEAEIEVARQKKKNLPEVKGRKNTDLRFLNQYFTPAKVVEMVNSKEPAGVVASKAENVALLKDALTKDILLQRELLENELKRYGIIEVREDGNYAMKRVNLPQDMSLEEMRAQLDYLTVNYMVANIEFHKIYYGDPYQYKDELKRIKNFNSPRQAIISNSPVYNRGLHEAYNQGYEPGDIGYTNLTKDYMSTSTFKDVKSMDEAIGYGEYEETDGSGIIQFKAYRNFRIRAGKWNDNEERQFRYDIAFEKKVKGESLTEEQKKEQGLVLSEQEYQLLERGNPKIKSAYTPLKPIVSGNKLDKDGNPRDTNDIILDKYALYPLSFRVAHEMNSESNQVGLYNKMISENIDYVVFNSGRKVGAEQSIDAYKDGKINTDKFFVVNVPLSAIAIQTEVPSKDDNKVSRGTQPTKLVTMDLMDAGVPVDFGDPTTPFEKRIKEWNNLSEEKKLEKSKIYKEVINNRKLLVSMMETGLERLNKQLGLVKTPSGYEIQDRTKAGKILREELLKREMNDNIHMAIDSFLSGNSVLEATPAYQQIRNIIYSIIDREVTSQKMTGGQKVQIASTFFETRREKINGKDAYVSDNLKFYVDKDGERVMEVMVGRWFDSSKTDEELIEYFNTKEGQEILSGVAYRIPTQKQNSIDRFVIKKFLPVEFGDSVVIPSQLVKKTGSDFDIDKLTMYFRNLRTKTKNGYPVAYKLLNDSNSTVEERYIEWVNEIADKETKRLVTTLSKSDLENVKNEYKDKNKALKESLASGISTIKSSFYNDYVNDLKEGVQEIQKQFLESYLFPAMDTGSDIFKTLPDYIKDYYFDLKKDMAIKNINGPVEFENYLALTAQLKDGGMFPEASETFDALIDNYEEILRYFGLNKDYIDDFRNKSIDNFRNKKQLSIAERLGQYEETRDQIRSEKKINLSQFEFDKAVQVARLESLPTLDEFSKRPIEKQNILKALQNEYVTSLENLISSKENFKAMTAPNSADVLKKLADEIAKKVGKGSFDYTKVGNMLSRYFMSSLRHDFVTGKYAVGIAAVNQTNHALNQLINMSLSLENYDNFPMDDKYYLTMGTYDVAHLQPKFKNINRLEKNDEFTVTLSRIRDAKDKYEISDILSQFLDGYVDISKGSWIMDMGANPTVASVFMILVKMGVPIDQVVYFMNQPIIRDYLRSVESAGYTWKYIPQSIELTLLDYANGSDASINYKSYVPSATDLQNTLGKQIKDMTPQELAQQRFMLMEFLKMSRMADHMFLVMQGSNYDTANFNDGYLIFKKAMQQALAMNTVFDNVNDILKNSFIGPLSNFMIEARDYASAILKADKFDIRKVIQNVLTPFVRMNDQEFTKLSQTAVANLFDWAVQNDQQLNQLIKSIMIENGGSATKITNFVNTVKVNPQHPLHENLIIKLIQPLLASDLNGDKVNVVKIKSLENKVYDQNNLIFAFRELREYLESINSPLYEQLKKLAILQSGLSRSSVSFTSVLPFEDFEAIYNPTLSKIERLNLINFHNLDVFYRNNWNNNDIVPSDAARAFKVGNKTYYNVGMNFKDEKIVALMKSGEIPQLLTRPVGGRENVDFVTYYWEDNIPQKQKDVMKRQGDTSYTHRGLFKMVKHADGEPLIQLYTVKSGPNKGKIKQNYVYKAINAWGDGQYANEYYNAARPSVINNGMIKVEKEVTNDAVIVKLFEGNQLENTVTSQNKPSGLPGIDRSPKSCN